MIDHAALVADSAFPSRVKREIGRSMFERAIARLAAETRKEFLNLARSGDEDGGKKEDVNVEDIVKTNSFTVSVGGGSYMVLFPRVAVSEGVPIREIMYLRCRLGHLTGWGKHYLRSAG